MRVASSSSSVTMHFFPVQLVFVLLFSFSAAIVCALNHESGVGFSGDGPLRQRGRGGESGGSFISRLFSPDKAVHMQEAPRRRRPNQWMGRTCGKEEEERWKSRVSGLEKRVLLQLTLTRPLTY